MVCIHCSSVVYIGTKYIDDIFFPCKPGVILCYILVWYGSRKIIWIGSNEKNTLFSPRFAWKLDSDRQNCVKLTTTKHGWAFGNLKARSEYRILFPLSWEVVSLLNLYRCFLHRLCKKKRKWYDDTANIFSAMDAIIMYVCITSLYNLRYICIASNTPGPTLISWVNIISSDALEQLPASWTVH